MSTTNAAGMLQLDAQGLPLDPSRPVSGLVGTKLNPLPVWSAYEATALLARANGTWAVSSPGLVVIYWFCGTQAIAEGCEPFASAAATQARALAAMERQADVSGITSAGLALTSADIPIVSTRGKASPRSPLAAVGSGCTMSFPRILDGPPDCTSGRRPRAKAHCPDAGAAFRALPACAPPLRHGGSPRRHFVAIAAAGR